MLHLDFASLIVCKDLQGHHPDAYPPGWRPVIHTREDWVKNRQEWPGKFRSIALFCDDYG